MKILVTTCSCGEPIEVPIKRIAQLMVQSRKNPNSKEHMKKMSLLGVQARKNKKI